MISWSLYTSYESSCAVQISGIISGLAEIARTHIPSTCGAKSAFGRALTYSRYSKVKAQTRCNIRTDTGWTRAEKTGMKYCCLYFARGCCPYGYECNYRHRLPDPTQTLPDTAKDCFARDKFADYRDDMGGVGSFQRENRTLYIGRIKETGPGPDTEEVVRRHFSEWGEIDRCKSSSKHSRATILT